MHPRRCVQAQPDKRPVQGMRNVSIDGHGCSSCRTLAERQRKHLIAVHSIVWGRRRVRSRRRMRVRRRRRRRRMTISERF